MMVYDFNSLQREVDWLLHEYSFVRMATIGRSVQGRPLYALRLGTGERELFYNGAHHGQEWITAKLLMRFAGEYASAFARSGKMRGHAVRTLFEQTSLWIVPMVNPDGIEIGKKTEGWQANANGVDLNHNYDAGWHQGKQVIAEQGIDAPGPTRYSGTRPESEPESQAIVRFTCAHSFEYVVALHSQGKEIYWNYGDCTPPEAKALAERFSAASGYALEQAEGAASYSGFKDWFIQWFGRPGFTIEVGEGENPLPLSQFDSIYEDILEILLPISV